MNTTGAMQYLRNIKTGASNPYMPNTEEYLAYEEMKQHIERKKK